MSLALIPVQKFTGKQFSKVKDLELHPFLKRMGLDEDNVSDFLEIYNDSYSLFQHHDTIVVNQDRKVISNPLVYFSLMKVDAEKLVEVDVVDIDEGDLIRFINTKSVYLRRNYKAKYQLFKELKRYLKYTEKGMQWLAQLKTKDKNIAIAKITGYSESMIKQYLKVGSYGEDTNTDVFSEIGFGETQISMKEAESRVMEYKTGNIVGLPLNNHEREMAAKRQQRQQQKADKQMKAVEELNGNENLKFLFEWREENKMINGNAFCLGLVPNEDTARISNAALTYQYKNDSGAVIAEIKVDIDKAFKKQAA